MMEPSYDPRLIFTRKGNLVAIVTDSVACTEHEEGSKPLQDALCNHFEARAVINARLAKRVRANPSAPDFTGIAFPDLLESKRIVKNPEGLQFFAIEQDGREPEAVLGYVPYGKLSDVVGISPAPSFAAGSPSQSYVLSFREFGRGDKDLAAAWDSGSFAVRVRGKKYVKALRDFYDAMLNKKVAFAGTFMQGVAEYGRLSGLVLADTRYISDECKRNVKKVEEEQASELRLEARADVEGLRAELFALVGYIGYISPRWMDRSEREVGYRVRPTDGVNIEPVGPYTKEQLLEWAKNGGKVRLTCSAN